MRRQIQSIPEIKRLSGGRDIPRDKSYPENSAQCDGCGGYGCGDCHDKGWVAPNSRHARRCPFDRCDNVIPPYQLAIYCSNRCAWGDA